MLAACFLHISTCGSSTSASHASSAPRVALPHPDRRHRRRRLELRPTDEHQFHRARERAGDEAPAPLHPAIRHARFTARCLSRKLLAAGSFTGVSPGALFCPSRRPRLSRADRRTVSFCLPAHSPADEKLVHLVQRLRQPIRRSRLHRRVASRPGAHRTTRQTRFGITEPDGSLCTADRRLAMPRRARPPLPDIHQNSRMTALRLPSQSPVPLGSQLPPHAHWEVFRGPPGRQRQSPRPKVRFIAGLRARRLSRAAVPPADQFATPASPERSRQASPRTAAQHQPSPAFPDRSAGSQIAAISQPAPQSTPRAR